MLHLDDLEHYKWDFESISPRKSYPYEKYWLAQHCLWGGVEAKTIPKNRFMLHKDNISISSVQDCQWGGVNRKCSNKDSCFLFYRNESTNKSMK